MPIGGHFSYCSSFRYVWRQALLEEFRHVVTFECALSAILPIMRVQVGDPDGLAERRLSRFFDRIPRRL
jgi:hypothetical protein